MITPYYEYVGLSVFEATFLSEPGGLLPYVTSWYNVTQDDWASVNMVGVEGFAPKIIKIPNTGEFRDAYGYIISPVLENWVVGIQKTRGEWEGPFVQVGPYGNPTNQCADGNSNFDNSWLTLFNNSEVWEDLFSSELTCVGSWFDDEDPDSEANLWCPIWLMDNTDILAYNPWFYALPLTYEDLINSFEYVLFSDMMEECPEGTTFEDVAGISAFYNFLPDSGSINSVVITKLDKQGPQPYLHLDYKSFFDINGMFAGFSHSFEEGLYALMMTTQHGQQVFRMLDVQGTLTVSGTYADLIDVNVFPVPITGNNYQISLLSPLQTRVNYIFADVNGTVLHRQLLSLEGGEQGTFRIAPRSGVPSGVHVHRFEFADGSHTTVTSTK